MDFDLNETYDPRFPYGFDSIFDNEHFVWNMDYEQSNDGKHGSPSLNAIRPGNQTTNDESNDGDHARNDQRCSDGFVDSPLHNEHETIHSPDYEDEMGEYENGSRSLILAIEKKLSPGEKLDNLDQAYVLYCEYGRLVGFSVKKGIQKYYGRTQQVRKKEFNCSCHGKTNAKQSTEIGLPQFRKQDFRTNCKAMLTVLHGAEDGKWHVTKFVNDHNHELSNPQNSYLLRSSRYMSYEKKSLLEALHSAGIRVTNAYRFMEKEAGGPENMGFTRKDVYNHMDSHKKRSRLDDADSNALVKHFMEKSNKEHDFYWNMQTDSEGRILNFFFRDSRSAVDYDFFGDVLSVDTTYKTNKYDLICAPFVGVNHHMKNCLFGLAFLSDETTATFEWLFSTFLDSMHGKEPGVVFSDQCVALMNGIDSEFKSSTHRLCQWHINQNAPSHFGSLNSNKEFKSLWFRCMNSCESVDEFETTWKGMINDYDLVDNRWFRSMYNLRARWSSCFSQDKFCAGLHATSRSEVTNKVLKDISSSSGSLYDFVMKYEQILLDWRRIEAEDDTASLGVPGLLVANNPILKHAAKYLTRKVFLSYEYEATHSLNMDILDEKSCDERGFLVKFDIRDCEMPQRIRSVTYNKITSEVSCTCCMWQTVGVLCAHVFKIYFHHNVKVIPSAYLLRCLSREAKTRRVIDILREGDKTSRENNRLEDDAFKSHIMRSTYDLINDVNMDFNMKAHLLRGLETLRKELLGMRKEGDNQRGREPVANFKNAVEQPVCRDPVLPQNRRFTKTRLSRHWEKPRRKGKKRAEPETGRINIPTPRRRAASPSLNDPTFSTNSPATTSNNVGRGHDFMSSSPRHVFTSRSDPPNFYSTQ